MRIPRLQLRIAPRTVTDLVMGQYGKELREARKAKYNIWPRVGKFEFLYLLH